MKVLCDAMSFGARLREIMLARGVDQTTLARELRLTSQAVSQWANDTTIPRGQRLRKIAEFLSVTEADLVAPVGAPISNGALNDPDWRLGVKSFKPGEDVIQNAEELTWLRIWRKMRPERRLGVSLALSAMVEGVEDVA